jgi:hypothetical protein
VVEFVHKALGSIPSTKTQKKDNSCKVSISFFVVGVFLVFGFFFFPFLIVFL